MMLITGFVPYKEKLNASEALISSMRSNLPDELRNFESQLAFELIEVDETSRETEHQTLETQLLCLLKKYKPTLCIFTGQAPPYNKITIEKVGLNSFMGQLIHADRPVAYWSDLPGIETLPAAVEAQNIPATHSYYAGQHLCNHILHSSLYFSEHLSLSHRSGFIHIPVLPGQVKEVYKNSACMPLEMTRKALLAIIKHVMAMEAYTIMAE
ncbi:hypothetical protein MNBD_GAMMA16-2117 [hydrothermal vent metagenome]|uniref:pyroglutamyl-peptidase I n=1 Tax=hydrothermal vent metagenome TaxID=652676 RepID=A0A3B0ZC78_9ZZZZ